MSKKVYIGGGKHCYTDNCSQHDITEAGQLIIRANEAAISGNTSEFLKYREEAAEAEKRTGQKSRTAVVFPSFSPDENKPKPVAPIADHRDPADQVQTPQISAEDIARRKQQQQQAQLLMLNDIKSYAPGKETNRNGESIIKFHKEIGFPYYFRAPKGSVSLRYTNHAVEEAQKDRYGNIPILDEANFDEMELIEVKYNQTTGRVDRMLFRQQTGQDNICIVVSPGRGTWNVITTWFNRANDDHRTLDRSSYAVPHSKEQILAASRKAA